MTPPTQRVLLTGATGGLGRSIARVLSIHGFALALHGRDCDRVEALAAEIQGAKARGTSNPGAATRETATRETATQHTGVDPLPPVTVAGDVAVRGEELVAEAAERLGGLTGVIHAAGIQPVVPFAELTVAQMREMCDTNLVAAHAVTRAAAAQRAEWVTLIASIEALRPAAGHAHYAAAKAGLVMYARAAALECAPLRVNAVSPGLIAREGLEHDWPEGLASWRAHAPLSHPVTGEDIAEACRYLATARAVTGHNLVVDAGMTATPGW